MWESLALRRHIRRRITRHNFASRSEHFCMPALYSDCCAGTGASTHCGQPPHSLQVPLRVASQSRGPYQSAAQQLARVLPLQSLYTAQTEPDLTHKVPVIGCAVAVAFRVCKRD